MKPLELYIHIPFCIRKCYYCDFLSAPAAGQERQSYVESLCEEIRSYGSLAEAYRIVTIFVGGGTPSILEPEQMEAVFSAVRDTFPVARGAEITVEMNPGTVDMEKLETYRRIGVNRLSIGLQSADDGELLRLGRIHTFEQFLRTWRLVRAAGFRNVNVDLMSAIPGQTVESWERTLRAAAEPGPEHISAYSLIIEEGTPFFEKYGDRSKKDNLSCDGRCPDKDTISAAEALPDEDGERLMYYRTKEILEAYGYHRYEISNYAKDGFECRHNLGYWERAEYLGVGTGAASLMNNSRWIEGEEPEALSREEQMEEFMFLGLRKTDGISKAAFKEQFGCPPESVYGDVMLRMTELGLLKDADGYLRLSERGIDVSNCVMSEFLLH